MKSRIVKIKRRPNTSSLPDHVFIDAKRKIGSIFTKNGKPLTGLTLEEQRTLMPHVIGLSITDSTFYKEVERYFLNISINVPEDGVELDASVDENGTPINVVDYVKFKYVQAYKFCAENENSLSRIHKFYIHDKEAEMQKQLVASTTRKDAYKKFLSMTEKNKDFMLTLLGFNIKVMDASSREIALEKEVQEKPNNFLSLANDKNLEMKAFIESLISGEVLRRIGTAIINGDETIGQTIDDAIVYLKDKKNSDVLVSLKARLNEYNKKK